MITAVTDIKTIRYLQKQFEARLKKFALKPELLKVGHANGVDIVNLSYCPKFNIWYSFNNQKGFNKYWNAFGVGKPTKNNSTVVEINYRSLCKTHLL